MFPIHFWRRTTQKYGMSPYAAGLHQLPNRLEHDLEVFVVASFEIVQSLRQVPMLVDHRAHAHEGSHDLYVHADGCRIPSVIHPVTERTKKIAR